jgi:uncharacterized repeat protein (TIGR01451 family)
VVVVGAGQQLSISKQVSVVGGGPAFPGSQLEYVVQVVNIAAVPAFGVVLTDTLPPGLAYVSGSATMNGSPAGVSVSGGTITADYGAVNGPLAPGGTVTLRFRATLDPALSAGTVVTNTGVVTWNTPAQTASASVSIEVASLAPAFLVAEDLHRPHRGSQRSSGRRAAAVLDHPQEHGEQHRHTTSCCATPSR